MGQTSLWVTRFTPGLNLLHTYNGLTKNGRRLGAELAAQALAGADQADSQLSTHYPFDLNVLQWQLRNLACKMSRLLEICKFWIDISVGNQAEGGSFSEPKNEVYFLR